MQIFSKLVLVSVDFNGFNWIVKALIGAGGVSFSWRRSGGNGGVGGEGESGVKEERPVDLSYGTTRVAKPPHKDESLLNLSILTSSRHPERSTAGRNRLANERRIFIHDGDGGDPDPAGGEKPGESG